MLPSSVRISKKDFSLLFRKADGKVFFDDLSGMYKTAPSFHFAPVCPKKLRLSSVKMHYERRIAYHIVREYFNANQLVWKDMPCSLLCFLGQKYIQLSFLEKKTMLFGFLKKVHEHCRP